MKRFIFLQIVLFVTVNLWSQISFKTGDIELETDLNQINAKAKLDFGIFKTDIGAQYDIDGKKIDYMSVDLSMEPAEIYLALEISRITNRNIDDVLNVYQIHKDKGWGYIAKKMGIKPGSDEFHKLKNTTKNKSNNAEGKGKGKNKVKKNNK